jgi:superfamily II DNA/RNA helicase
MDVFMLRDAAVDQYAGYVSSSLKVADERLRGWLQEQLGKGIFWPQPLLQLNPSYEFGCFLQDLVDEGKLHPQCIHFFGNIRLYKHQQEAIGIGLNRKHFIVSSGTGSGKTLTYLVPIVDWIFRNAINEKRVCAIIVYPMNALANSQLEALKKRVEEYEKSANQPCPIRFGRYTGQEGAEERSQLKSNPPHILLTNFMMLELMLVRPEDRCFIDEANLQFVVLDELHSYRGRQGADVALLLRRLRVRSKNPNLVFIGTSATLATGESREERRYLIADAASKIFGVRIEPENVVEETLRRVISYPRPISPDALKAELLSGQVPRSWDEISNSPLAAWIEDTFGIEEESDGHLRRRKPITLQEGARKLSDLTGVDEVTCLKRLKEYLLAASNISLPDSPEELPVFGIRLHQFISQGGTVFATVEPKSERLFSLEGQSFADSDRLLFPLAFCRECGQDYCLVVLDEQSRKLLPRPPLPGFETELEGIVGYLMLDEDGRWSCDAEHLPDNWTDENGRVRSTYRRRLPREVWALPDGTVKQDESEGVHAWFIPRPFGFCLNCGQVYLPQEKEFRKLAFLAAGGRSTATTLIIVSALGHLEGDERVDAGAKKVLSFTDNRQDAALQSGHFNDFVETALLRSALVEALRKNEGLTHDQVADAVYEEMGLDVKDFAKDPQLDPNSPVASRAKQTFKELLAYRIYEDLRYGGRVTMPNLEQVGLLRVEYLGLKELSEDESKWEGVPLMGRLSPTERYDLLRSILDRMRQWLAIEAHFLDSDHLKRFRDRALENLSERWFGENESLRSPTWFVLGPTSSANERSLSFRSRLGRDIRRFAARRGVSLDTERYEVFIKQVMEHLRSYGIVYSETGRSGVQRFRVKWSVILWRRGDGQVPKDVLQAERQIEALREAVGRTINDFFRNLYSDIGLNLKRFWSGEHTAQVAYERRLQREELFRTGELPCLFCSPTMELGIDIRDLHIVHLRNVPPTPTNYAQRSGRAGRAGKPALVFTYAAFGNSHDQYFFRRREEMVAGRVRPPRLDLTNEDLIATHIHAIWLAKTGVSLGQSVDSVLELNEEANFPMKPEVRQQINLSELNLKACLDECRQVLQDGLPDLEKTDWFSGDWLERQLREAPEKFDRAFDRWRELYRIAEQELRSANEELGQAIKDKDRQRRAERRQREAIRQRNLLLQVETRPEESDFYPYRYLASEGFLPGYNFPRLPLRAFVPYGEGEFISRPRFLALTEFGPRNILYHEGAKYRVVRSYLPPGGIEMRLRRAKWCLECGYFHEGSEADASVCSNCGSVLDGSNSIATDRLFEMTNIEAWRVERIFCDEEERLRYGFKVTTHFRFAPGHDGKKRCVSATVFGQGNEILAAMAYGAAASLVRINHGWRTARAEGFGIDQATGYWAKSQETEESDVPDPEIHMPPTTVVRIFVQDTHDIMLFGLPEAEERDEEFWASLQYALLRGMQVAFDLEENELAAERIGQGKNRRILFWEAAEGSMGVLKRLVSSQDALAQVARAALEVCHFDPQTGEDKQPECVRACYDCLLSYNNQLDHLKLNRHAVRDYLLFLSQSQIQPSSTLRSYDEQYEYLRSRTDPESELERRFLDHLYRTRRRLPDDVRRYIREIPCEADFFYEPNICVFCDGAVHDRPEQRAKDREIRARLKERGYRVIVIRYDRDLEEQIDDHKDVFGVSK